MSETERWRQAREFFLDLVEMPVSSREEHLEAKARVDPELAAWTRDLLSHDDDAAHRPAAPQRLGPYEILRSIGRGGMGEVFVARRADGEFEREVAIKRLHKGHATDELIRRFLRERQTLARLDHEYVAGLLDGGTTEAGEPYLVMEYVDGEPADVFSARLPLRERLELFLRIARAVAHAHERGFVHRDLKPSNILVRADGSPRLLDFGIAGRDPDTPPDGTRGSEPLTRTGLRMVTPEYASPEQVRGEPATTRSDLFALGVILYELITGAKPWSSNAGQHALERSICEDEPLPPSRRNRTVQSERNSADLDAIVLQCLAKRPEERYASVDALREDVQRYLDDRPIRARRTSTLAKLVRHARNRPAHAAVAMLIVLVLIVAGLAWQSRRAGERRIVELRAAVEGRVAAAQSYGVKGDIRAAEAELAAAELALRELPGEAVLEAEVLSRRAVFASARREWKTTRECVDRAFERLKGTSDPSPHLVARLLNSRAYALQMDTPGEESLEACRAALDYTLEHVPLGDVLRMDALTGWAVEMRRAGRDDEFIRGLENALTEARAIDDPRRQVLPRALNELAGALAQRGRFDVAGERYREALKILSWNQGESHPSFAIVRHNFGNTLFRSGKAREAQEMFERSLLACRAAGNEELIASNQQFLARIHYGRGELAAAESAVREAEELRERNGPPVALLESRCMQGIVLAALKRADEARLLLTPVLADSASLPPELEAEARHRLGVLLEEAGDAAAARGHLESALEQKRAYLGADHADCLELELRLGRRR